MLAAVFWTYVSAKGHYNLCPGWALNQRLLWPLLIGCSSHQWRGPTTVLPDHGAGETGRILNQNGLWASWASWASWACSSWINNSGTAEFSCVWINAVRIHWHLTKALILLPVLDKAERQSWASFFVSRIRGCRYKELANYRVRYAVIPKLKAALCFKYHISSRRAPLMSSSASLCVRLRCWPALRIIQAVYSLEGFSLSRHLAPRLRPPASPAPHPGTQPLHWTGASWSWSLPAAEIQWERAHFTKTIELHIVSPLLPLPVCVACFA